MGTNNTVDLWILGRPIHVINMEGAGTLEYFDGDLHSFKVWLLFYMVVFQKYLVSRHIT